MAQVVLLNDLVTGSAFGASRYIGPYAVGSHLRRLGIDVVVIDYFTKHPRFFEYLRPFLGPETLAVGISSTFLSPPQIRPNWRTGLDEFAYYRGGELQFRDGDGLRSWLANLKQLVSMHAPTAKLVLGGAKALAAFKTPAAYADFDFICIGAGDISFSKLVLDLKSGQNPEFKEHNGLKVLADIKMKSLLDFCPDAEFSKADAIQAGESLPIEISRGCAFNCKFCSYEKKASVRKDLGALRAEMIRNYEQFGTTVYHFTDDCFNDHREKVESYCEMFLSLPFSIEWVSYARVDVAVKFPHTLDLMVKSGARGLFWGIESLNDEVARRAGKGTPSEKVKKLLVEFSRDYGSQCLSACSFIVGLPGESAESIFQTRDFLCENRAADILHVSPLIFAPYHERLDLKVIDYADYSRNPQKYGFEEISFSPDRWRHALMDSDQAGLLAHTVYQEWVRAHHPGVLGSIFHYPHLRTLGYSHDQIAGLIRGTGTQEGFWSNSEGRFRAFLESYFAQLAGALGPIPQPERPTLAISGGD